MDPICAITAFFSIVVATVKVLTVVLAFVTALVRLLRTLQSRRRRRYGRGRVHPQDHAVADDEWLSKILEESGSPGRASELVEEPKWPSGRPRC